MLLLCIPMLLVYMYLYVTRMYSYVLVCTLIYLYVGSMYSYVTHMLLVVSVCVVSVMIRACVFSPEGLK